MLKMNLKVSLMVLLMGSPAVAAERLTCTPFKTKVTTPNGTSDVASGRSPVRVTVMRDQLIFAPADAQTQSFACDRAGDLSTCVQPGDVVELYHATGFLFRTANYRPGETITAMFSCRKR